MGVALYGVILPKFRLGVPGLRASTPVAAFLAIAFVATHALGIAVGDSWWDTIHLAVKANQLILGEFFALAEGHRPVVSGLITVFSA